MCEDDYSYADWATFVVRRSEATGELMVIGRWHSSPTAVPLELVLHGLADPEVRLGEAGYKALLAKIGGEVRSWLL